MPLGLSTFCERDDVPASPSPLDDRLDVLAPGVEGRALLVGPFVALIDADDAGTAPRDVVEHSLGDFKPNAELLQSGRDGTAKIVEGPAGHAASPIEASLGLAPTRKNVPFSWKNKIGSAEPRLRAQQGLHFIRKRDDMLLAVLRSGGWQGPDREARIKLAPREPAHFLAALPGQQQRPHDRVERPWPLGRLPSTADFIVRQNAVAADSRGDRDALKWTVGKASAPDRPTEQRASVARRRARHRSFAVLGQTVEHANHHGAVETGGRRVQMLGKGTAQRAHGCGRIV